MHEIHCHVRGGSISDPAAQWTARPTNASWSRMAARHAVRRAACSCAFDVTGKGGRSRNATAGTVPMWSVGRAPSSRPRSRARTRPTRG